MISWSKILLWLILCAMAVSPSVADNETVPKPSRGKVSRQLILVGYDIKNNSKARDMLESMSKAAQEVGAESRVIYADEDGSSLRAALSEAVVAATGRKTEKPALHLLSASVNSGDQIIVQHSAFTITNRAAWIGFYKAGAGNKDYISYTFLNNLTSRIYDVTAPNEKGLYEFRVYPDSEYDPIATSDQVEVK